MGRPEAAPQVAAGPARGRWGLCALLFGATLLNYLDRQALSVMAPLVRAELRLDLAQLGLVFSVFYWAYAAGQIGLGVLLDRVRVRPAYATAVGAWSLAGAAAALATGLPGLLAVRALLGVCEAGNWPTALRVVARAFPPAERSLASGLFQSGTSVGALLAPPALVLLAGRFGWRAGFAVVGLAGLGWVALWLAGSRALPDAPAARPPSLRAVLRSPRLWRLAIASAFLNPCLYFYVNWLPTFFVERGLRFGADLATMLMVVYLALDVGYISGGALAARLARTRSVDAARSAVATAGVPLMAAVLVAPRLPGAAALLVLAVSALGLGWFMVQYLAFASDVAPGRESAAAGLLGAAGSISGGLFMALVGALAARSGGFALPFALVAGMPVIAIVALRSAAREDRA